MACTENTSAFTLDSEEIREGGASQLSWQVPRNLVSDEMEEGLSCGCCWPDSLQTAYITESLLPLYSYQHLPEHKCHLRTEAIHLSEASFETCDPVLRVTDMSYLHLLFYRFLT